MSFILFESPYRSRVKRKGASWIVDASSFAFTVVDRRDGEAVKGISESSKGVATGRREREGKRLRGHQLLGSASQSAFRLTFSKLSLQPGAPRNAAFFITTIYVLVQSHTSVHTGCTRCYWNNRTGSISRKFEFSLTAIKPVLHMSSLILSLFVKLNTEYIFFLFSDYNSFLFLLLINF